MRNFLDKLDANGELSIIKEKVSPQLEAGALSAAANNSGGPALLMENISGYPGCFLASGIFSGPGTLYPHPQGRNPWMRMALALGMDRCVEYEDLMNELLRRRDHLISPAQVANGPCKEVRLTGNEADLTAFPWPKIYEGDGGAYITAGIFIAGNRSGTWVNWSICRGMVHGSDKIAINMAPDSHICRLYREYEEKGEPMPVSIVIGANPACFIAAASSMPWGMSEASLAGALKEKPIALVAGETNSLLVPAEAEMVLEGEILPNMRLIEGPFPEYTHIGEAQPAPVFQLKCITHRRNPIIPFVAEGVKVNDSMALRSVLISLELMYKIRRQTQLKVRWINLPVEAKLGLCVAACHPVYRGHNFWVMNFLLRHKKESLFDKLLLVDADINPVDMYEVLNDWTQKTIPKRGQGFHVEETRHPLAPTAVYTPAEGEDATAARSIVWDCCWPEGWSKKDIPVRVTFEHSFPEDIQKKVIDRWPEYGFSLTPSVKQVTPGSSRGAEHAWTRFSRYVVDEKEIEGIKADGETCYEVNLLDCLDYAWHRARVLIAGDEIDGSAELGVMEDKSGVIIKHLYVKLVEIVSQDELAGVYRKGTT